MAEVPSRKEKLVAASEAGSLLEAVYSACRDERREQDDLALDLADLHNNGLVDIFAEFTKLEVNASSGIDFFITRRIFEKSLPHTHASVDCVMRTVLHLFRCAGQNGAAGSIFAGYINFCAIDSQRPREALKLIEADPNQFADMLPATIHAGSLIDNSHYLEATIRLSQHSEKVFRQRAITAMSHLQWQNGSRVPDSLIAALERSCHEADEVIQAAVIKTAYTLYQQDNTLELRIISLIGDALSKGNDLTLEEASMLFACHANEIPMPLKDILLRGLIRVNPKHHVLLENIDYGLACLLQQCDNEKALLFLEELLLMHPQSLSIRLFATTAEYIRSDTDLLSRVMTRWFLKGSPVLGQSVNEMGATHHGEDLLIDIDTTQLQQNDSVRIVFIARKAIGYFFLQPVTAASIVISLMRYASDEKALEELAQLLFDPLLLSYPGCVGDYVKAQCPSEAGQVKEQLKKVLSTITCYLDKLAGVPSLPALHPSQTQRESYRRYFSDLTAVSFRAAEKESLLSLICTKQTLLYGRKSIYFQHTAAGETTRMEAPLLSNSVEIETPRMDPIDPYGLDFILHVFRAEHICQ
jgi:hypothetical protein